VTAIANAAAASAAVSTATQKLNRASAPRVAVRSTCFAMRPERDTFNQFAIALRSWGTRMIAMAGSPSAPLLCVRRGVDHHAGQQ
jgi:hypothetical protein